MSAIRSRCPLAMMGLCSVRRLLLLLLMLLLERASARATSTNINRSSAVIGVKPSSGRREATVKMLPVIGIASAEGGTLVVVGVGAPDAVCVHDIVRVVVVWAAEAVKVASTVSDTGGGVAVGVSVRVAER